MSKVNSSGAVDPHAARKPPQTMDQRAREIVAEVTAPLLRRIECLENELSAARERIADLECPPDQLA